MSGSEKTNGTSERRRPALLQRERDDAEIAVLSDTLVRLIVAETQMNNAISRLHYAVQEHRRGFSASYEVESHLVVLQDCTDRINSMVLGVMAETATKPKAD